MNVYSPIDAERNVLQCAWSVFSAGYYAALGFGILNGWASVLNTQSSRLMTFGSLNVR